MPTNYEYKGRKKTVHAAEYIPQTPETPPPPLETKVQKNPPATKALTGPTPFLEDERTTQMGIFMQEGLDDYEAAVLAGYAPVHAQELRKSSKEYRDYVEMQTIKFKRKHLQLVNGKSDAKTSQWLLEKRFPNEYGSAKRGGGDGEGSSPSVLTAILRTIQRQDNNVISETRVLSVQNQKTPAQNDRAGRHIGLKEEFVPGGASILRESEE